MMHSKVKGIARPKGRNAVLAVLEAKLKEALRYSGDRPELGVEYLADPTDQVISGIGREMAVKRVNQNVRIDLRHTVYPVLVPGLYFMRSQACPLPRSEMRRWLEHATDT